MALHNVKIRQLAIGEARIATVCGIIRKKYYATFCTLFPGQHGFAIIVINFNDWKFIAA